MTWAIQTVEENGDHGWLLQIRALLTPGDSSDASFSLIETGHASEIKQLRWNWLAASRTKSRGET